MYWFYQNIHKVCRCICIGSVDELAFQNTEIIVVTQTVLLLENAQFVVYLYTQINRIHSAYVEDVTSALADFRIYNM